MLQILTFINIFSVTSLKTEEVMGDALYHL